MNTLVLPIGLKENFFCSKTQVGSPAVRLRLARCAAGVKRWSEAMDFIQTIFKTYLLIDHLSELYYKGLDVPSSIPLITQGFSSHPNTQTYGTMLRILTFQGL